MARFAMFDRLVNLVTGLGTTAKDKSVGASHVFIPLSQEQVESTYRSDWLSRKIIDIVPFDMTRRWREWQADEGTIEALEAEEKRLFIRYRVRQAMSRARLYGNALLYMGLRGQNPEQPINIDIKQGDLEYILPLHKYEVSIGELDMDPLSGTYGQPKYYQINRQAVMTGPAFVKIHPSRFIRWSGNEHPNPIQSGDGWDDSLYQTIYEAITNVASSQAHIASMLPEAKVDIVTVPGLSEHLSTDTGTTALTKRFQYMNQLKSVFGITLLEGNGKDDGESWQQKQINFAQFPDLLRQYIQVAAGAADIPITRLLGQSPTGFNATGESDIRNYYDHIQSRQEVELGTNIDALDEVVIRSALGNRPSDVYYNWRSLWQPTEKERAETDKARAETSNVYLTSALVPQPVLLVAVRNQLIESGAYPGIEKAYEEYDNGTLQLPGGMTAAEFEAEQAAAEADALAAAAAGAGGGTGGGSTPPSTKPTPRTSLRLVHDAAPRTLYVQRKLINTREFLTWARKQKIKPLENADDLHVTLVHSSQPVDWMELPDYGTWSDDENGQLKIQAGGARLVERIGDKGAVALFFKSEALTYRHTVLCEGGCSSDYGEYKPHVTIAYLPDDVIIDNIQPYQGPLIFGPELWAEID